MQPPWRALSNTLYLSGQLACRPFPSLRQYLTSCTRAGITEGWCTHCSSSMCLHAAGAVCASITMYYVVIHINDGCVCIHNDAAAAAATSSFLYHHVWRVRTGTLYCSSLASPRLLPPSPLTVLESSCACFSSSLARASRQARRERGQTGQQRANADVTKAAVRSVCRHPVLLAPQHESGPIWRWG